MMQNDEEYAALLPKAGVKQLLARTCRVQTEQEGDGRESSGHVLLVPLLAALATLRGPIAGRGHIDRDDAP